jgi:hypothetical protein
VVYGSLSPVRRKQKKKKDTIELVLHWCLENALTVLKNVQSRVHVEDELQST